MKRIPAWFWLLCAAVGAFFLALILESARAHEWYPSECCSIKDCGPAVGVARDDIAQAWLMPNGERILYGTTRPTPDGVPGIHWCRYGSTGKIIVNGGKPCVFVPKAGG